MEKPGKCLPWEGEGPCIVSCANDWTCNGVQKCCPVGCGRMCQNPCNNSCDGIICEQGKQCQVADGCAQCLTPPEPTPAPKPHDKPGACFTFLLPRNSGINGNCTKYCKIDNDCKGRMKCCSIGCSSFCQDVCSGTCKGVTCDEGKECQLVGGCAQCVTSDKEKPGKCRNWQGSGPCLKNCAKDYDCPSNRKCCSVGCGKICTEPCPKTCDSLPPCLAGSECQVSDGCAQCVSSTGNSTQPLPMKNNSKSTL